MSDQTRKNKNVTLGLKKAKERRTPYLQLEIPICDNLSPYALKLYCQLRKLVDYQEEHDETKITVESLAILSNMSIRKAYQVLNELEKEHYLIQRLNSDHWRYGQTNSYDVAQTYGFFKKEPNNSELNHIDETFITPAQYAVPTAQYAVPTAQYAVPYIEHNSFHNSYHVCGETIVPQHTVKKLKKQKAEEQALNDPEAQKAFNTIFSEYDVTYEDMFHNCQEHFEQKSLWATKHRFLQWIKRERPENYKKIQNNKIATTNPFTEQEILIISDYNHALLKNEMGILFPKEQKRLEAEKLYIRAQEYNKHLRAA
ncbi:MAG: hypothetical protein V4506_12505 [Bacteroidota bacterium]